MATKKGSGVKGLGGKKGTGFNGSGSSSKYVKLPASSNASLGIKGDFVQGLSTPAKPSGKTSREMNSGANVGDSAKANTYGDGAHKQGGVGSRENMTVGPPENRGDWSRAAGNGKLPEVGHSIYGPGARAEGTAVTMMTGTIGRGGSMALAAKGIMSGSSGPPPSERRQAKNQPDLKNAQKGVNKRGRGDE